MEEAKRQRKVEAKKVGERRIEKDMVVPNSSGWGERRFKGETGLIQRE